MNRIEVTNEQKHIRMRGLSIAAFALITTFVVSGACVLDTKTTLCEQSGRRCSPGQMCAIGQDACIPIGGCGDGIVGPDEVCDDGNIMDGDGCNADCSSDETCGNGKIDIAVGESCDDRNVVSGDGCSSICHQESCGNNIVDGMDECDTGGVDTQGCNSDCTFVRCGDGKVNIAAHEGCDDGPMPSATCNSPVICKKSECGDGFTNLLDKEKCDDGNMIDGDNCDSNCTPTGCGNGIQTSGEQCDDGNATNGDGCDSNCTLTACGNGIKTGMEECDDGNAMNGDGCDNNCTVPRCGNGIRAGSEQCDDGNMTNGDGCDNNCTNSACGNGVAAGTEECDDGNTVTESCPYGAVSCMVCDSSCKNVPGVTAFCGDGKVNGPETCDDHNILACGTCSSDCQIITGAQAIGSITAVKVSEIISGETFTLSDGLHAPLIFEFRKGGSPTGNHIEVDLNSLTNGGASQVRQLIASTISGLSGFDMEAGGSGTVVTLKNKHPSEIGNVTIQENIADSDFIVSGMSGGAGVSCSMGTGCASDKDCASLKCTNNVCE